MTRYCFDNASEPMKVALWLEESGFVGKLLPVDARMRERILSALMAADPIALLPA